MEIVVRLQVAFAIGGKGADNSNSAANFPEGSWRALGATGYYVMLLAPDESSAPIREGAAEQIIERHCWLRWASDEKAK